MTGHVCHIVVTRFNVRTSITAGRDVTSEAWLRQRFDLFERFCLPGMLSQSVPHQWLVWFDANTPRELRRRAESYPGLTPVWVDGILDDESFLATLAAHVPTGASHLITTRLDNDDAVATTFLKSIQKSWHGEDDVFINFPIGYQWHDRRVYYSIQRANPFLSHVERLRRDEPHLGIRSVTGFNHETAGSSGALRQVWGSPVWVQVLHGDNVANEMKGIHRPSSSRPRGFANLSVATESASAHLVGLARSSGFLLSMPWRKRKQLAQRLRQRAEAHE
jgi:hypothetical protein